MLQLSHSRDLSNLLTGTLHNDGTVTLRDMVLRISDGGSLTGTGRTEVLEGTELTFDRSVILPGTLRIDEDKPPDSFGPLPGTVRVKGSVSVGQLEWGSGKLEVDGPVTVNGLAHLHHGVSRPDGVYEKTLLSDFHFNGGAVWAGDADLDGPGRIHLAAGTVFVDQTARGVPGADSTTERPIRLAVVAFHNHGTYLKTGRALSVVESSFENRGTVRTRGAGMLRFTGALDNRGSLEAVGARLEVQGPLAQWSSFHQRLRGGRYLMKNRVMALNLGVQEDGSPRQVLDNGGELVLDGPQARLVNIASGRDTDALAQLRDNSGRLRLLGGARLVLPGDLTNAGLLEIGAGSTLTLPGWYWQSSRDAATWLGGTLGSQHYEITGGRFGAGLEGEVGQARLLGGDVHLDVNSVFEIDVVSPELLDTISAASTFLLHGELWVDFATPAPQLGSYRIVTAPFVGGYITALGSNLDPARYRVEAILAETHLDLRVTAVPEPQGWALLTAGLAALLYRRQRQAGTAATGATRANP
ncbi:hypothetical protein OOT46_24715 [Aquabacterium sp. A7-Y]|uniref:hypothetical protein n=1 Tax=Aquabacterium sp. A7-Y TaxID=1349605 RepID=UPI00223DA5E7|nr:hypothetical protein [Aquabacterium sp. A7-Y]MCW7541029.1 hypothetical protein [Aquabacterium sp. A7-Y]